MINSISVRICSINNNMSAQKEFSNAYEKCIVDLKQIKADNDYMNKMIGVTEQEELYRYFQKNRSQLEKKLEEIGERVGKMQKNYLDPDNRRKVLVIRQQLIIQKDRRKNLTRSIQIGMEQKVGKKNNQSKNLVNNKKENSQVQKSIEVENIRKKEIEIDCQDELEKKVILSRTQQLKKHSNKLNSIKQFLIDTKDIVSLQGNKIDLIDEDLTKALTNVKLGDDCLDIVKKKKRKPYKKYIGLCLCAAVCVAITIFLTILI